PEIAFRCGPLALDRIRASLDPTLAGHAAIQNSASGTNGFSLDQVAQLSSQLGMSYQAGFRSKGASLVVPSVVHWKVGHYAAIVGRENDGRYHVQDPTFGKDAWVTARALEEEASGYFLIPAGELPRGWRTVSAPEAGRVFGKGTTSNNDP